MQDNETLELIKEAHEKSSEIEATKARLGEIAGSVADALIKAGELDADKREQAIKNIVNDPIKVAMCLKATAESLGDKQQKQASPAPMGNGAEINKTAGVKSASQRSAADHAFLTKLGLV